MRKSIKYSLLAVLAVMGLASCSNDYEYSGAEALKNAQVFFADTTLAITSYDLDMNANSFDVEIQRVKTDGELTVALENHQDPTSTTQLNVPASVTFADGAKTATITIGYNPETIEFEDLNRDTLIIANAEYTTPYGGTEYRFAVSIAEPWSPWFSKKSEWVAAGFDPEAWPLSESESTCTYTYNECPFSSLSGEDPGLPIYYRVNINNPVQAQFKIEHWAFNVELILDYNPETHNVVIPMNFIGAVDEELGPFYMTDVTGWQQQDYYSRFPCTYDPEAGKFVLNVAYVTESLACYGYGEETIQVDGFYVPDYSARALYAGILKTPTEDCQAVVDFKVGIDVDKAKYALTEATVTEAAAAAAIVSGELEAEELPSDSIRVFIPLEEDGKYRATIVTFDEEGNAQESASCVFEFVKGESPWQSLGMALYTDDIVGPLFKADPVTYEVEVFEHKDNPGLYRLKNAYGEAYPYNEEGQWDTSMDYYLEINATDPTSVYFEEQDLGLDWGYGMMSAISDAARYLAAGYDIATIKENGIEFGTLVDGVITFPVKGIIVFDDDGGYYANTNGDFKLVLPGAASESGIKAAKFARRLRGGRSNTRSGERIKKMVAFKTLVNAKVNSKPVTLK